MTWDVTRCDVYAFSWIIECPFEVNFRRVCVDNTLDLSIFLLCYPVDSRLTARGFAQKKRQNGKNNFHEDFCDNRNNDGYLYLYVDKWTVIVFQIVLMLLASCDTILQYLMISGQTYQICIFQNCIYWIINSKINRVWPNTNKLWRMKWNRHIVDTTYHIPVASISSCTDCRVWLNSSFPSYVTLRDTHISIQSVESTYGAHVGASLCIFFHRWQKKAEKRRIFDMWFFGSLMMFGYQRKRRSAAVIQLGVSERGHMEQKKRSNIRIF